MDEHPLIHFADGPSGCRARLVGGPDVWEVVAVARDNDGDLAETAAYLELSLGLVQAAVSYYAAHPQEVDERIERNCREADDAHGAFLAAHDVALQRLGVESMRHEEALAMAGTAWEGDLDETRSGSPPILG